MSRRISNSWRGLSSVAGLGILWVTFASGIPAIAQAASPPDKSAAAFSGATSDPEAALASATAQSGGLGVYFDFDANEYVAVFPDSVPPAAANHAVGSFQLPIRVEYRPITPGEVAAIRSDLLARRFAPNAGQITFGTWFDPRSGKVIIDSAVGDVPFLSLIRQHQGQVDIRDGEGGRDYRGTDGQPHWGGASIVSPMGGCTSGYSATKSNGTTFMVTAAHCARLGDQVEGGSGLTWGTVTDYGPFPDWDVELINGSYAGSIYVGNLLGTQAHVKGGNAPAVGSTSYCVSGYTTTETCGHHAVSLNGTLCDSDGCTPGLVVFHDGTLTQSGDSGAPWYNHVTGGVTIRGSHVGHVGADMYAENFLLTKSHWSLTIMTS